MYIYSVSHSWGWSAPPFHYFFESTPIKADAPDRCHPLKNEVPTRPLHDFFGKPSHQSWCPQGVPCSPLKNKAPFQKMIPRKETPSKNWKLSLILCFTHKITLQKDDRNSTNTCFHLEHSKFCKKSETGC